MKKIELSPVELNPANPIRRAMPRPANLRQPDYEERFDSLTIFYDCFRSTDAKRCVFIGPPLLNLAPIVLPTLQRVFHCKDTLDERVGQNPSQLWLRTTKGLVELPAGMFAQSTIAIQTNLCDVFRDRKVLLTQSRNNELQWIHDWVHFFARKHGCDAVLLYDNASTNYDADCLQNVIQSVPGIEIGLVVRWPYKYGPPGSERHHPIKIPWDSNYSQLGVLQHARHRFLSHAQAVVNADVDELVLTRYKSSVFDLVARSDTGYLSYTGHWIEGATESASETCRHVDFFYRDATPGEPLMPKWAVSPRRCPDHARWLPHKVENMKPDRVSASVSYRHFRAISTSWKYSRGAIELPNVVQHVKDEDLIEWMEVFEPPKWAAWRRSRSWRITQQLRGLARWAAARLLG
jgi:hypothetical protein